MARVTISSKKQITLPVEMVRALGLKAGDKLDAELIDDRIVLWPKPPSYADYFAGSMKGVYGSTKEEIDRYLEELRAGPEREAWREEVRALLATNPAAQEIVDYLRSRPNMAGRPSELEQRMPLYSPTYQKAMAQLVELGVVREKRLDPPPKLGDQVIYLIRELAPG